MIVLDTNVVSEVVKPKPSEVVLKWLASQDPREMFLTTITQAEILVAIAVLPQGRRKTKLADAVEEIFVEDFEDRVWSFDEDAARMFATIFSDRMSQGRPIAHLDAMIAAITHTHGAALATRHSADFEGCGIKLLNPWAVA